MPSVEIISQGDEVLTGQIVDSNAAWLSERLTELGFSVLRHNTVGDRLQDIRAVVEEASARADLCLCTGGLGPTEDDLTSQAVAEAMQQPLVFDPEAMRQIEAMFARFGKPMPESNRKQAMFPAGARRLENRWGTAPGFAVQPGRAWMVFLPGVPREMQRMFESVVVAEIAQRFELHAGRLVTLRTAGIGESALQQRIGSWGRRDVVLSYRTAAPENQIKLRFPPAFPEQEMRAVVDAVAVRIGAGVFAIDGLDGPADDLPSVTLGLVRERGETLAVAEWGCGGRLCSLLNEAVESQNVLRRGYVWGAQDRPIGVASDAELVSEPVARALAERVQQDGNVSYGLGLTVASRPGPQDSPLRPGSAHMAVATADGTSHRPVQLAGGRDLIRTLAAASAVDFLRRHILRR